MISQLAQISATFLVAIEDIEEKEDSDDDTDDIEEFSGPKRRFGSGH